MSMRTAVYGVVAALWASTALAAPVIPAAAVPDPLPANPLSGVTVALTPFVADSFGGPQSFQSLGDGSGRLAINDTGGALFLTTSAGGALGAPYLNLSTATTSFDGPFMGVAFAPNFATSGKFYTAYQAGTGSGIAPIASSVPGVDEIVIREWTATNPQASTFSGTSREVMRMSMPSQGHTIGSIGFNPNATPGSADYNKLYIGMGDTGDNGSYAVNAQNLAVPYGKILRLDPTPTGTSSYTVPADNPFVATAGAEPLVWAYGLRNPQSFSWQIGGAGTMFINDIGEGHVEEVNTGVAGGNYGWSTREGTYATFRDPALGQSYTRGLFYLTGTDPGLLYPVAQYYHDNIHLAAIGGGYLYKGAAIPALYGKYIVSDIPTGKLYFADIAGMLSGDDPSKAIGLRELTLDWNGVPTSLLDILGQSRADARLGLDDKGEIYVITKGGGQLFSVSGVVSVPEPRAWVILGTGMLAILLTRRTWPAAGGSGRRRCSNSF
jgi:glucose/arabinose dehydrogenase